MAIFLFYDPASTPSSLPNWDAHLPDDTTPTAPAGFAVIEVPDPLPGGMTDYDTFNLKIDTSVTPNAVVAR
jgi:hypothetical protein